MERWKTSHELDDNIQRRKQIVAAIPAKGLTEEDFRRLLMSFGYNSRGATEKAKELFFLKYVHKKEGKVYAKEII